MDEIKTLLRTMQVEIRQQKLDMQDMKQDIKNTINNNINEKFKHLESKNEQLEQKLEKQKFAIENLERCKRRKKLLFFGVEETEKCYHSLEAIVVDIIKNILKINCENNSIEYVRRHGRKGEKIRPIVVTMLTMGLKIKNQQNKKKLDTTSYYIKEDYPPEMLNKRKELQKEVEKEREQGRKAVIKYDKLIILKNKNDYQNKQFKEPQEINSKKRSRPESPEITAKPKTNQNKNQPSKINKTNVMENFILKTPTFTYPDKSSSEQQKIRRTGYNIEEDENHIFCYFGEAKGQPTRRIIKIATEFYKDLNSIKTAPRTKIQTETEYHNSTTLQRFSLQEISTKIKALKKEKSTGPDSIPNEAIIAGEPVLTPLLTTLFNKILDEKEIPCEWVKSDIVLLYKKGNPSDIDALQHCKKLKWKWAGHVARMDDEKWTKKLTTWKGPLGKRNRGRPVRWLDEKLKTAGSNWKERATDRIVWRKMEEAFTL
ncbi:hypothetical protein MSG28_000557 [Choristoneura fumiferana]|uniref:Uncharacterized protein n=1 Tax=Choristoneura fumiferana TaxID=7141 RepID=A0ACC0K1I6_CHOFU|nr:hypothetical protein MSG28_000557 [Choristoneura fumiferana]